MIGEGFQRFFDGLFRSRDLGNSARLGDDPAGPAPVAEERDRCARARQDHVRRVADGTGRLFGEIGQAIEHRQVPTPLQAAEKGFVHHSATGCGCDACRRPQAAPLQCPPAEEQHCRRAAPQDRGGFLQSRLRHRGRRGGLHRRHVGPCGVPRALLGDDQGGDLPGRAQRGTERVRHIPRGLRGCAHRAHPPRHRPRQRRDVGRERRVRSEVPAGMVADQVDDRRVRAPCVVQVGKAVGEPRAQVKQGQGRDAPHARVPIRRPGANAFEEAKHRAHAGHRIQGRDQLHLGGPGVGKTHIHPGSPGHLQHALRAVHARPMLQPHR
jgi:hypothetical protein